MEVICQILINKPNEEFYKAGDTVTGVVKFKVDEPTEYKDVRISFVGKGKCVWSEQAGRITISHFGQEHYVSTHLKFNGDVSERILTLHGNYKYPFSFSIPENAPSTYTSKNQVNNINYCVALKLEKPGIFSVKSNFTAPIPVRGFVDCFNNDGQLSPEKPVIFGLEKTFILMFGIKKAVISLTAELAKTRLSPGENAHVSCKIVNQSNVAVIGLDVELYCYKIYTADTGRTRTNEKGVKNCKIKLIGLPAGETWTYTCVVPTLPECYSVQNSRVISREYVVRATLRLPMPHKNVFAEAPVVIGNVRSDCCECNNESSACESSATPRDQPPSYWEVMCEETASDLDDDGCQKP